MSDTATPPREDILALRGHLFEVLRAVRSGSINLDQARMVNELAKTLIDSARAETEFARATGEEPTTGFLAPPDKAAPPGIVGIRRHLIK